MEQNMIRFAIIGTEGIGRSHEKGMQGVPNAKVTAVCDINEEYAKKAAVRNGLDKYYTDYKEMLKDGGFDCVIVCTPDKFHRDQSVDSLNAGYHVLCEKPLTMTLEECEDIVNAAKKSEKIFMVGQVCRKTPGFVLAKQLVDQGEIGELFLVESEYAHDYSILERGEWRKDPEYLRHPVVGGGCHAMDLLRWIAGDPTEVFAYANHKVLTDWPVDDCTIAIMKYPNNVIGKVMTSIGCKRPYTMRTCLYGDKGTIIVDNTSPEMTLYKTFKNQATGKTKYLPMQIPIAINNHNMTAEIQDMCDVISGKVELDMDAIVGANTVALCLAAVESAATGKPVTPKYFH